MPDIPPIGRTWRRIYAFVLITLVITILAMYAFAKAFA
jgi:Mg2+ and Co2+ transporter CorA